MFLRSATLLKHVVPAAITSMCITIQALKVEVPRISFRCGGFLTGRDGRYKRFIIIYIF
jgi:hypothetical protein